MNVHGNGNFRNKRWQLLGEGGLGGTARWLLLLSVLMVAVYVLVGAGSYLQSRYVKSPAYVMRGLTAAFPSQFFVDMLALEAGSIRENRPSFTFSSRNMTHFLFRFLMDINPADPKTLLASELPELHTDRTVLLRLGAGGGDQGPRDYHPAPKAIQPSPAPYKPGGPESQPTEAVAPFPDTDPQALLEFVDNSHAAPAGREAPPPPPHPTPRQAAPQTEAKAKKVLIYHTHNRESFLPELKPGLRFDQAQDDEINVTLAGRRLAERLEELGIGAVVSDTDYPTAVEQFNWNESYRYSLQTVKEAFAVHPDLQYFLDIHRDAGPRKTTTATIDGVEYAQLYFIIGQSNPNWQQNEQLASEIHQRLESLYPGISRGIWGKQGGSGNNGEYNQSFSPGSLLIEVGGVENSLEEVYRTIDVLAKVLAEVIWDAEKV